MSYSAYVFGNGISRKNIDPGEICDGHIIGCNAFYRDFDPDIICAIDAGIFFDIVEYDWDINCNLELCYFTHNSWNPLPAHMRHNLGFDEDAIILETTNKDKSDQFVVISGFDREINQKINYIIWEPQNWPNSGIIKNIGNKVEGWSTGTSAVYVACRDLKPDNVYLIGFDHQSNSYDNFYANTPHYFKSDSDRNWSRTHRDWSRELLKIFTWYPDITFYWVNHKTKFTHINNLHFIEDIWQV